MFFIISYLRSDNNCIKIISFLILSTLTLITTLLLTGLVNKMVACLFIIIVYRPIQLFVSKELEATKNYVPLKAGAVVLAIVVGVLLKFIIFTEENVLIIVTVILPYIDYFYYIISSFPAINKDLLILIRQKSFNFNNMETIGGPDYIDNNSKDKLDTNKRSPKLRDINLAMDNDPGEGSSKDPHNIKDRGKNKALEQRYNGPNTTPSSPNTSTAPDTTHNPPDTRSSSGSSIMRTLFGDSNNTRRLNSTRNSPVRIPIVDDSATNSLLLNYHNKFKHVSPVVNPPINGPLGNSRWIAPAHYTNSKGPVVHSHIVSLLTENNAARQGYTEINAAVHGYTDDYISLSDQVNINSRMCERLGIPWVPGVITELVSRIPRGVRLTPEQIIHLSNIYVHTDLVRITSEGLVINSDKMFRAGELSESYQHIRITRERFITTLTGESDGYDISQISRATYQNRYSRHLVSYFEIRNSFFTEGGEMYIRDRDIHVGYPTNFNSYHELSSCVDTAEDKLRSITDPTYKKFTISKIYNIIENSTINRQPVDPQVIFNMELDLTSGVVQ